MFGLLYACLYKFLGVAYNAVELGFKQINNDIISNIAIHGKTNSMSKIAAYLPLIKGSTVVAFVLVFIDMIKELPITLIVRPFNYDTLSTRMYEYISDERFKAIN